MFYSVSDHPLCSSVNVSVDIYSNGSSFCGKKCEEVFFSQFLYIVSLFSPLFNDFEYFVLSAI